MARGIVDAVALSPSASQIRSNTAVTVFEEDGTTPFAGTLYSARSGGTVVTSPTTNSEGLVKLFTEPANVRPVKILVTGDAAGHDYEFRHDPREVATVYGYQGRTRFGTPGTVPASTTGGYVDVIDPFSSWTETVSHARAAARATIGGFALSDEYQNFDGLEPSSSKGYTHAAMTGAVEIPSSGRWGGSTTKCKYGVMGIARTSAPGSGSAGLDAVGVYGQASALVAGSGAFAGNFLVDDRFVSVGVPFASAAFITSVEADFHIWSPLTRGLGVVCVARVNSPQSVDAVDTNVGNWSKGAHGFVVNTNEDGSPSGAGTFGRLTNGILVIDGAAEYGIVIGTNNQDAADTAATNSMPIVFRGRLSGTTVRVSKLYGGSDGALVLQSGQANGNIIFQDDGAVDIAKVDEFGIRLQGSGRTFIGVQVAVGSPPAAPSAGDSRLWPADDGAWYLRNFGGAATRVLDAGSSVVGPTLNVGATAAGFGIVAQLRRLDGTAPIPTLGFNAANGGAEADVSKFGLGFKRTSTQGVGDVLFMLDNATDTAAVAESDLKMRLQSNPGAAGAKFAQPYVDNSAMADADMPAGSICFFVNETGNVLSAKVKYAAGTIKTLTAPLAIS